MMGICLLVLYLRFLIFLLENCGCFGLLKYLVVFESRGRIIVSYDGFSGVMEI